VEFAEEVGRLPVCGVSDADGPGELSATVPTDGDLDSMLCTLLTAVRWGP